MLFYFDDMPTAQMAEALDISLSTLLLRLARASDALKGAINPLEAWKSKATPTATATATATASVTVLRKD